VGPAGEEGPLTTVTKANFDEADGYPTTPYHCDEDLADNHIDTKEDSFSEVTRINGIPRGSEPSVGPPDPPTGLSSGSAVQEHMEYPDWGSDSTYAWIKWGQSLESDLAGYHVERAGSVMGPWERVTKDPIAWWETRYDLKGVLVEEWTIDDEQQLIYLGNVGPDCVVLRVVAVDEEGLESAPSAPQEIPAGCSRSVPAALAPANLLASTASTNGGLGGACQTKLRWPRVAGADKYHVYRFMLRNESINFYRTHTRFDVDCGDHCEYVESGDPLSGDHLADCADNPGADCACPWNQTNNPLLPSCINAFLQAFYVTAAQNADASGYEAESPPSKIVFWDCSQVPGYARLEAGDEAELMEAIAAAYPESRHDTGQAPICTGAPEVIAPFSDAPQSTPGTLTAAAAGLPAPATRELSAAPLLTLGQGAPSPPYAIYDLHWDHLGSTRVVTNETGTPVSYHDFYPFGEEIANFFDYNTKLFTGHERDEETGLDYMLARYYGSNLARFLSVDPVFGRQSNPQSFNRYSYTLNNPLRYIDPDGLDVEVPTWMQGSIDRGMPSAEFSSTFSRLDGESSVHVDFKLVDSPAPGAKMDTDITLNPDGSIDATVNVPAGEGGDPALVGHELEHVEETLDTGKTLKRRVAEGESGVWKTERGYESQRAIDSEKTIRGELKEHRKKEKEKKKQEKKEKKEEKRKERLREP